MPLLSGGPESHWRGPDENGGNQMKFKSCFNWQRRKRQNGGRKKKKKEKKILPSFSFSFLVFFFGSFVASFEWSMTPNREPKSSTSGPHQDPKSCHSTPHSWKYSQSFEISQSFQPFLPLHALTGCISIHSLISRLSTQIEPVIEVKCHSVGALCNHPCYGDVTD